MRRGVVLLLVLVVVAGVSAWLWLRPSPAELMAEFVADLRARGEPVTIADIDRPPPPDEDNGAIDLARGFRWLESRLAREDRELAPTGPPFRWAFRYAGPWNPDMDEDWATEATAEQLADVREFLGTLGPFFDAAATAVGEREIAWPPSNSACGPSFFGPNSLASMKTWLSAVRLLNAQAVVAESQADRHVAIECAIGVPALTRHRTSSDYFYAAHFRRLACLALRDGVEHGRLLGDQLHARIDPLLTGNSIESIPSALRATRAACIEQYPALCDGSIQRQLRSSLRTIDTALNDRPPPSALEDVGHSVADAVVGLRFDPAAYVEGLRGFDALIPDEAAWNADAEAALLAFEQSPGYLRDGSGMQLVNSLRATDAAERLARVALAACEYRRLHGEWPQTLGELAPLFDDGVPLDPYSDAPFRMTRAGAALVLSAARPATVQARPGESLRDACLEWRLTPR